MTHVLRIAHLRIALHVANPEVGNREGIQKKLIHLWTSKAWIEEVALLPEGSG